MRICPKCGSSDITSDLSVIALLKDMAQNDFICNKCGYQGQFFPEKITRSGRKDKIGPQSL